MQTKLSEKQIAYLHDNGWKDIQDRNTNEIIWKHDELSMGISFDRLFFDTDYEKYFEAVIKLHEIMIHDNKCKCPIDQLTNFGCTCKK